MKTTKKPRTPDALKGKTVQFFRLAKTRSGCRMGTVLSVDWAARSGLKTVTVRLCDGAKIRVTGYELCMTNHPTGVLWRGNLTSLVEWLDDGFLANALRQVADAERRRKGSVKRRDDAKREDEDRHRERDAAIAETRKRLDAVRASFRKEG